MFTTSLVGKIKNRQVFFVILAQRGIDRVHEFQKEISRKLWDLEKKVT